MKFSIVNRIIAAKTPGAQMQYAVGAFERPEDAAEYVRDLSEKYGTAVQGRIFLPTPRGPRDLGISVGQLFDDLGINVGHRIFEVEPVGSILVAAPKIVLTGN